MVGAWCLFIFIVPYIIDYILSQKKDDLLSEFIHHSKKYKLVIDYEKNEFKKYGKVDPNNLERERKSIEDYWNNEYPEIEKLDLEYKERLDKVIATHNNYSLFTPMSFYFLVSMK